MFFKIRSLSQKIFILFLTVFFQPCLITAHKNHNKHEIEKLEKNEEKIKKKIKLREEFKTIMTNEKEENENTIK